MPERQYDAGKAEAYLESELSRAILLLAEYNLLMEKSASLFSKATSLRHTASTMLEDIQECLTSLHAATGELLGAEPEESGYILLDDSRP